MALEVGGIFGRAGLRVDDDGFDRFERRMDGARRDARNDINASAKMDVDKRGFDDYDRQTNRATKSNGRLVGTLGAAGIGLRAVGTGAVAGAAGVGILGKTVVETATSIQESLNRNEVLFGRQAKAVENFADRSAKGFGISKRAALDATGTFGNLFTALDIAPKKAATLSVELTKLAADMASFNNTSPEEALEALRSGLVGETEPLRKFGVNLNDATLRAEALRKGLVKNTKEALDPQTRALAVNSLVFDQTRKAQGDFERTSGGLANQTRILRAQLSDLGAELGERVLPFVTKAVTFFNGLFGSQDKAAKGAGNLRDKLGGLGDTFSKYAGTVVSEAKKVAAGFKRSFSGIEDDLKPILAAVAFVATGIYKVLDRALPGIRKVFTGLFDVLRGIVQVVGGLLSADIGRMWRGIRNIFGGAVEAIAGLIRAATAPWREAAQQLVNVLEVPFRGLVGFVKDIFGRLLGLVSSGLGAIAGVVGKLGSAFSWVPGVGDKIKGLNKAVKDGQKTIDEYRESLRKTEAQQRRQDAIRKAREEVRLYKQILGETAKDSQGYRETVEKLEGAQRKLNKAVDNSSPASKRAARGYGLVSDNLARMGETASDVTTYVAGETNKLLQEFGASRIKMSVKRFRSGQRGPGLNTSATGGFTQGMAVGASALAMAGGGWLPGEGNRDTVPVMAAPGEGFVNKHQRPYIERAMAVANAMGEVPYGSMTELFGAVQRPHYAARGGFPKPDVMGSGEGFVPLMQAIQRTWGPDVYVFSGLRPGSTIQGSGGISNHSRGAAVDITHRGGEGVSGPPGMTGAIGAEMDKVWQWISRYIQPQVGLDSLWRTFTGGNHYNHIHQGIQDAYAFNADKMAGFLEKVPGGAGLTPKVARLLVGGGTGSMNKIIQGQADSLVKGANRKIRRSGAFGGSFTGDAHAFGLGGGPQANIEIGRKMAARYGWTGAEFDALVELWTRESGWDANAVNPSSGAAGIPQALGHGDVFQLGDAPAQIKWGLDYIKGRYGSPSAALAFHDSNNWYAKGGLLRDVVEVGDSLGEGTYPFLKGALPGDTLRGNNAVSRTSGVALNILKGLVKPKHDGIIFDVGTNDGSPGTLRSSIRGALKVAGKRPVMMASLKGRFAGKNNPVLQDFAKDGRVSLIPWAGYKGRMDAMGVHPLGDGYKRRAGMFGRLARSLNSKARFSRPLDTGPGFIRELLSSGSSPAEIAAAIAEEIGINPVGGFRPRGTGGGPPRSFDVPGSYTKGKARGGFQSFESGGFVTGEGGLTGAGTKYVGRTGQIIGNIRGDIDDAGRKYELQSRKFDFTQEEFINEGSETVGPSLNQEAITRRVGELNKLIATRRGMAMKYGRLVAYLSKLNRLWRTMERRLEASIEAARQRMGKLGRGKEAKRTRNTLEDRVGKWSDRLRGVRGSLAAGEAERSDADYEWQSTKLDLTELRNELAPLLGGGKGIELPSFDAAGADSGSDTASGGDADQAAIAAQATRRAEIAEATVKQQNLAFGVFSGPGDIGAGSRTALGATLNPSGVGAGGAGPGSGQFLDAQGNVAGGFGAQASPAAGGQLAALTILGDPRSLAAVASAANAGNAAQPNRLSNLERVNI